MTVEAALQSFGPRCLVHLLRTEPAALAGEPEGTHQMRVAVRRLRAVLSAFKPMLPMERYEWTSDELKWLGQALGPARNWDMFEASLLPPVSQALPDRREFDHLANAAERCRQAALDGLKQTVLSTRYTLVMLRVLRWFAARGWQDQPLSERAASLLAPAVDIAPGLIRRSHRKARQRCKRFAQLARAERHKLRIALKKLRYLVEFLGSLFDRRRVQVPEPAKGAAG